jgi:integrase
MAAYHVETRHQKRCRTHQDAKRCNCSPSYRGKVTDPRTGKPVRSKAYREQTLAERWCRNALNALELGQRPDSTGPKTTVAEAMDDLLGRMRDGRALDRSGNRYRPATIRSYEQAVRKYIVPQLGHMPVRDLRRRDVQDYIDHLRTRGLAASTVHNKLDPLRVMLRHAMDREEITVDPCTRLRLPAIRRAPKQVADSARAEGLLDALPDMMRALWAVLFYAGLRISEARALRWTDIDLEAGELHVRRGWDDVEGEQDAPKTDAGVRSVPLAGRLRHELVRHKLATGRGGDDLVFGTTATVAPDRSTIRRRALKAWGWKDMRSREKSGPKRVWVKAREDALDPLTPHEARHTCASYLIAAGVNDMQLAQYIGHTDSRTTKNIYGHLFPDDRQRVAAALDAYLDGQSRGTDTGLGAP